MAWHFYETEPAPSRHPAERIRDNPRRRRAEIRALTGLRGVAALLVALYHINPNWIAPTATGRFVGKGYLWVDLFFVLSGFLLAMNYARLFAGGWSLRAWLDFLLHRVARIYPLLHCSAPWNWQARCRKRGSPTSNSLPAATQKRRRQLSTMPRKR